MSAKEIVASVIIPYKDREEWLAEAVGSVLSQTCDNYEILLVDDGSKTPLKNRSILDNEKVRYFREHNNQGPSHARNLGIRNARGRLIFFLDSDDLFLPSKLSEQIAFHDQNPEVALSYTDYILFNGHEKKVVCELNQTSLVSQMILSCPIATPTVCVKRNEIEKFYFDEDMRLGEDTVLWIRMANELNVGYINAALTKVRDHGDNAAFDFSAKLKVSSDILNRLHHHGVKVSRILRVKRLVRAFMAAAFYLTKKLLQKG